MQTLDRLYRSAVLGVAGNTTVKRIIRERGQSLSKRFVAGDSIEDALRAVERLEAEGVHAILDLLGEMVTSEAQANAFTEEILGLVDAIAGQPYPKYVSIKLTQLGLDLSTDLAYQNARRIVQRADGCGAFVRIDMEDSPRVDRTIEIFRHLREDFDSTRVGLVLQSALYRSEKDLDALADLKPDLRIVKGAYLEPTEVAYADKPSVDMAYRRLVYRNLELGNRTAVATHDSSIINDVKLFAERRGLSRDLFEFQLLYGIRRDLQRSLASEGYLVRAYIPYGREWYAYYSRRIAERPANIGFVLRGLIQG